MGFFVVYGKENTLYIRRKTVKRRLKEKSIDKKEKKIYYFDCQNI